MWCPIGFVGDLKLISKNHLALTDVCSAKDNPNSSALANVALIGVEMVHIEIVPHRKEIPLFDSEFEKLFLVARGSMTQSVSVIGDSSITMCARAGFVVAKSLWNGPSFSSIWRNVFESVMGGGPKVSVPIGEANDVRESWKWVVN